MDKYIVMACKGIKEFQDTSNDLASKGYSLSSWHPQLERIEHNGGDGTKVITVYHAVFSNHDIAIKAPAPEPMRSR